MPKKEEVINNAPSPLVTEQRQSKDALGGSEELYRSMIELSPDAIIAADLKGTILLCNTAATRLSGYSKDEMVGKHFSRVGIIRLRDMPKYLKTFTSVQKEEIHKPFELPFYRKDKTIIWTELRVGSLKLGSKTLAQASVRDITERKQSEQEMRVKDSAIASSINAIAIADLKGDLTYANPSFLRMWGYDDEKEVLGRNATKFTQLEGKAAEVLEALEDRGGWIGELVAKRKDSSEFDVQLSASMVTDKAGKPICMMGSFIDITERKRMERELQEKNEQLDAQNEELRVQGEELQAQQQELVEKTEEAARANQLKSEFLANMSHELRTPLNTIIGFSQLMLDQVPGKINQEQRQCLSDTLDSSQQLLNLINEVLDLSKIESGRAELKQEKVILTKVIASLTRSMMPILTRRGQSLDVEIEEGLPPVYADEGKLGQALLNLVDNASKFTPEGGKLKIEAVSDDGWCRVSVIDNGIGIKEEDRERIFEPFCQLENPLTKERSGTGLGLTLVKQIVKRYGGRIRVESEYGKGSRFTFTLPLAINAISPEERNRK